MKITIDIDTDYLEQALGTASNIINEIQKLYPKRDAKIEKLELF